MEGVSYLILYILACMYILTTLDYICKHRWSQIASKLPGRTDNEIKNYCRTHMRKMARECKRNSSASSSSSSSEPPLEASKVVNNITTEGSKQPMTGLGLEEEISDEGVMVYPMDQIWDEIGLSFEDEDWNWKIDDLHA